MVAVGMQKKKLGLILTIEMLMMGLIGAASGILGSLPVIAYLVKNPIRFTGEYAEIFESYGFEPMMPVQFAFAFVGEVGSRAVSPSPLMRSASRYRRSW